MKKIFQAIYQPSARARRKGWPASGLFWGMVAFAIFLGVIAASRFIATKTDDYRAELLNFMYMRAESLAWAVEGGARATARGGHNSPLSFLLVELSRQPGIAWLALVDREGLILADSNPELAGRILYTAPEIAALKPSVRLQARFSPDDPQIFETWKSFSPWRLGPKRHPVTHSQDGIIFVALDASGFQDEIRAYQNQLLMGAGLLFALLMACAAVIFYAGKYALSRRTLRDARTLVRQIINSYPEAMFICDAAGQVIITNRAARKLLRDANETNDMSQIPPGLPWSAIMAGISAESPLADREFLYTTAGGESIPMSVSASVIAHDNEESMGYLVVCRDLRQIRLLQRKLAESQKLSAIGQLAAGAAHEIRNPLGAICGYAAWLKQKLAGDALGRSTAELLEEEARRLDSALSDLLNLAKKPVLNRRLVNVDALLGKIETLALPDASQKNISLALRHAGPGKPLYADADRLLQALLNLVLNAIQALQRGGRIELSATYEANPENAVMDGLGQWQINVADNGPGISRDALAKIFTPYFTTRSDGTGLGLSLAQQIAAAHGGIITVESAPGHGAVFTLILPDYNEDYQDDRSCG